MVDVWQKGPTKQIKNQASHTEVHNAGKACSGEVTTSFPKQS
jgi:hypothetical protein